MVRWPSTDRLRRGGLAAPLIALAAAFASAGGARAADVPSLVVEAPPELAAAMAEIQALGPDALRPAMRLTGLTDPGPAIRVVLAPESSAAARAAPPWASGYANESSGVAVLIPARVHRYPDRGLESLLRHEVTHVLVGRAARGRPVPRWFDEGVAMAAGREGDLGDRARVVFAVLTQGRFPLARLDRAFAGSGEDVEQAYALSRDLVRTLLTRYGVGAPGAILTRVGRGEPFGSAFRAVTGVSLSGFETAYWRQRTFWDRWVPVITSSAALWGAITFLALVAFRRRHARDVEMLRSWDEESAVPESEDDRGDDELVN